MAYLRKILSGPGYRFISNTYSMRLGGRPRGEKRERTKEEMEKQNARNRAIHTRLLILGNFRNGWHITLTYPKEERPPDAESAKKELGRFFERAKRRFKKAGFEFKWLCVTEIGSRGAIHHHLIIEDIQDGAFSSQRVIRECWRGGKYLTPMYDDGEYQSLSEYLVKKESKEDVPGCRVTHSRNLIMPRTKREIKKGRGWLLEPRAPKGWELVKDSLYNGVNAFTGLPYQQYLLIEIGGKNVSKDIHIHNDKERPSGGRSRPLCTELGDTGEGGHTLRGNPV